MASDRIAKPSIERSTKLQSTAQCELVGILEVATDREPRSNTARCHAERPQQTAEVHRGGFTFDVRVRAQDDFGDRLGLDTTKKLRHSDLFWPNAFDGIQATLKHVVSTSELLSLLDRNDVPWFLDNTENAIFPTGVGAHHAAIVFADVEALLAERHPALRFRDGSRQPERVDRRKLQEVERNALSRLRANTWQSSEFVDEVLDRAFVHVVPYPSSPPRPPSASPRPPIA